MSYIKTWQLWQDVLARKLGLISCDDGKGFGFVEVGTDSNNSSNISNSAQIGEDAEVLQARLDSLTQKVRPLASEVSEAREVVSSLHLMISTLEEKLREV